MTWKIAIRQVWNVAWGRGEVLYDQYLLESESAKKPLMIHHDFDRRALRETREPLRGEEEMKLFGDRSDFSDLEESVVGLETLDTFQLPGRNDRICIEFVSCCF